MGLLSRRWIAIAAAAGVWLMALSIKGSEEPDIPPPQVCHIDGADAQSAVQRIAKFLRYQTISDAHTPDRIREGHHQAFSDAVAFLEATFPEVHTHLKVEHVGAGGWSRLFTWTGADPSLLPVLFISHYDVVPVTPGTEHDWTHPPFAGEIADGYLWGRGSLDVKACVTALLEAVTRLLKAGYTPARTIMISFGHDEETAGFGGAAQIAKLLQDRGVQLELVVDEGGIILKDGLKGFTSVPVAIVGTAEKLYTSLHVDLTSPGGHSSMPPTDGSDVASQAARLISHVGQHPAPAALLPPMDAFLHGLAPYASSPLLRLVLKYAHVKPISWLLAQAFRLSGSAELAALVRTTAVATRVQAGVYDNVLPQTGRVSFNMRSHPDVPRQQLLDYMQRALKATGVKGAVTVSNLSHIGPVPGVTPSVGPHFAAVKRALQEIWRHGDDGSQAVGVLPYLMAGGTDSKHYALLSKHGILRICPYSVNKTAGEVSTVHSTNERLSIADYPKMICTYMRMIEHLAAKELVQASGAQGAASQQSSSDRRAYSSRVEL